MTRPRIGITTSDHKSRLAWLCDWLAVWRAGGKPIRLSPSRPVPEGLDGLVIGGGDDIGAQLYGGEVQLDVRVDPKRDILELDLLERLLPSNCPVLGICRGAQIINVHLGVTVQRYLHHVRPHQETSHGPATQDGRRGRGSYLHELLGVAWCQVNSLHHQAIDRTGDTIDIVARDRDGLVQGIESRAYRFLIGVQWHPEFLIFNRPQQRLIRALVSAACEHAEQRAQAH
ncbi:gamma-glutamyl-gamma-aminobutyrate hydrolase family protein [Modicisalibacter luteus]|uniref:gamma-glutamyl-gamma-aminobutyrate hydrolase family protein n=1 Tax=Modicisalibacter luteus TaxID=453962 RepID=UPI0036352940